VYVTGNLSIKNILIFNEIELLRYLEYVFIKVPRLIIMLVNIAFWYIAKTMSTKDLII